LNGNVAPADKLLRQVAQNVHGTVERHCVLRIPVGYWVVLRTTVVH
jgi:hypothetical protein